MFVVDALVGNFDRHNGNWGFLFDEQTDRAEIAPVYNCGSCLLPQADERIMRNVLSDENEMNSRIFQFPTSAIKLNGKKINCFDFLSGGADTNCMEAIKRIAPAINIAGHILVVDEADEVAGTAAAGTKRILDYQDERDGVE